MPFLSPRSVRWLVILSAGPLTWLLYWACLRFPTDKLSPWKEVVWINDRFCLIQYQYSPYFGGMYRSYQCTFREYLIDCEKETRVELSRDSHDYSSNLPKIAPDGSILRHFPSEGSYWTLERINPATLETTLIHCPVRPHLVGNRFLVTQEYDEASGETFPQWQDILDASLTKHRQAFDTYGSEIEPVPGAHSFIVRPLLANLERYDPDTRTTTREVDWIDELKRPEQLRPTPLPPFLDRIEMTLLYGITERGIELLSRWPTINGYGSSWYSPPNGYIVSLRPDAATLDIRDGNSGQLVSRILIPAGAIPPDFLSEWRTGKTWLDLLDSTNTQTLRYDIQTGEMVHIRSGGLNFYELDSTEELILSRAPDLTGIWDASPDTINVQSARDLSLIRTIRMPSSWFIDAKLDQSQQQIRMVDYRDDIYWIDLQTGLITRKLSTVPHYEPAIAALILAAASWLIAFLAVCNQLKMPVMLRSVLLSIPVLFFAFQRIFTVGNPDLRERPARQVVLALAIAWLVTGVWSVFTKLPSLFTRTVFLTFAFVALYELNRRIGQHMESWSADIETISWLLVEFLILFYIARLIQLSRDPKTSQPKPFTLRRLILWTTLIGVALSWLASVNWPQVGSQLPALTRTLTQVSFLAVPSMVIWYSVRAGVHRFPRTLLIVCLLVTFAGFGFLLIPSNYFAHIDAIYIASSCLPYLYLGIFLTVGLYRGRIVRNTTPM